MIHTPSPQASAPLPLADHSKAVSFKLAGKTGKIIPMLLVCDSVRHHSRHFYVDLHGEGSDLILIDVSRLVAVIGDGGSLRHFNTQEVATIVSRLSSHICHLSLFKSIALPS